MPEEKQPWPLASFGNLFSAKERRGIRTMLSIVTSVKECGQRLPKVKELGPKTKGNVSPPGRIRDQGSGELCTHPWLLSEKHPWALRSVKTISIRSSPTFHLLVTGEQEGTSCSGGLFLLTGPVRNATWGQPGSLRCEKLRHFNPCLGMASTL